MLFYYSIPKGFYIADKSRSRYTNTLKSLATSLNMEYVGEQEDSISLCQMINDNKVIKYLKGQDYKTIAFLNYWARDKMKMDIDCNVYYLPETLGSNNTGVSNISMDEFSMLLLKGTMAKPFVYRLELQYSNSIARNQTLYIFDKLKSVADAPGPKFVFAHIVCPHTSFVFDRKGREVDPFNACNWEDKKYYLEQYIFVSNQMKMVVSHILRDSSQPPIIIIQSDHGPRGGRGNSSCSQRLEIADVEMHRIFNAYYLPGFDKRNLDDTMSPVNTFRLIFRHYFNRKIEILED